jgi:cytidylate kinase
MTLVTVSASYGAGGSRIAPALARRLDVPFLGRPPEPDLKPADDDLGAEGQCGEEWIGTGSGGLLSRLATMAVAWGTPHGMTAEELLPDQTRRRELERELDAFAASGDGVILGRGAAAIMHDDERALHVLLDGPAEARTRQAMAIEGIDRRTAERLLARVDRFRRAYLEDLYGVNPRAAGVFHLVLDSTAIGFEDCVDMIVTAARGRGGRSMDVNPGL